MRITIEAENVLEVFQALKDLASPPNEPTLAKKAPDPEPVEKTPEKEPEKVEKTPEKEPEKVEEEATTEVPAKPKKRGRKPKAKVEEASAPAPAAPAPVEATYESVRALGLRILEEKGREALAELLGKFGATKVSEIKEEDLSAIVAEAGTILEG